MAEQPERKRVRDLPDEAREKVLWRNAAALYRLA